jgi:hypothetical protein
MSKNKNADPIFAKIEAHRAAVAVMNAAGDVSAKMHADEPGIEAAEGKTMETTKLETKALRALLRCRPTTLAGVIALLDHLGQSCVLRDTPDPETVLSLAHHLRNDAALDEVRSLPHMLASALRSLVGSAASAT